MKDEWLEPGSVPAPTKTIPVADAWLVPELPIAPKPPRLPKVHTDAEKAPPLPRSRASKRPPKKG